MTTVQCSNWLTAPQRSMLRNGREVATDMVSIMRGSVGGSYGVEGVAEAGGAATVEAGAGSASIGADIVVAGAGSTEAGAAAVVAAAGPSSSILPPRVRWPSTSRRTSTASPTTLCHAVIAKSLRLRCVVAEKPAVRWNGGSGCRLT